MASPTHWTRPHWSRRVAGPALALVLAAAVAGCTATSPAAGTGADPAAPALTTARADAIFAAFRATAAAAPYSYGTPAFARPEAAGYPRFFLASVTRTPKATTAANGTAAQIAGVTVPADGRALLLFEQASGTAPWLLASTSLFPAGATLPRLATGDDGYVPQVPLSDTALLARPDVTGPLQAAVVDDGPASAAMRAIAAGPLTTGVYQAALARTDGPTVPYGDTYQWNLEGSPYPTFALRTASGGALVLYTMYLNSTVGNPTASTAAASQPPIGVPADFLPLLPAGMTAPRKHLEVQDLLSFAAVDPPAGTGGTAKVTVIAIGGGPHYATAS